MSIPENKPNLNYISLINHFWAVNQERDFTGNETKLYFFLLHVSNSLGWKNPFKHSLRQIQGATGISINSIKSVQKRLVEAGLITVKNGVAGDRFNYENKTEYTILSVSKIDTDPDISVSKIDTDNGASVSVSVSVPVSKIDTVNKQNKIDNNISEIFEEFRREYPGTKRGLKTELDNFLKKNKPETAELLLPGLNREKDHRNKLKSSGARFIPEWKNLQTWLNQKCWEQEFPQIISSDPRATEQKPASKNDYSGLW